MVTSVKDKMNSFGPIGGMVRGVATMSSTILAILAVCALSMLAMAMISNAFAASNSLPNNFEKSAEKYISKRMDSNRDAHITKASAPYKVMAELKRGKKYECWAVDMRVSMKLGSANRGRDTYTVLFYNGKPTALRRDMRQRVVRVETPTQRYSQR